jgi:nicotinamide-nucleotide amidase
MNNKKQAEVISIGTELLRGEITDTNTGYLASQLPLSGIDLYRITTVDDDREHLCLILNQALERSALVVTTGGLGPTEDDLTRECIATVLGEEVVVDAELEKQLRSIFERFGREMPSHNIKQAWLIPSARSIPNPRGTAPGWWVEKNDKIIVALPGPPRELIPMWQNEVRPRLQASLPGREILSRTIKTFAVAEATVSEMALPFFESDNPSLGIYSKSDGIHIRLIAHGEQAEQLLQDAEAKLEETFGASIWGKDEDTLAGVIGRWLNKKGLTLATIEDGTGGLLANMITNAADSSTYYRGGLIVRSNEMKIVFGLPAEIVEKQGAISSEVAEGMAQVARETLSADFGLSTTGVVAIGDPNGKQPGLTYVGITDSQGNQSWQQNFARFRDEAAQRGAIAALFRLRERLIDLKLHLN